VGRRVSAHTTKERDAFIPLEYFEKVPDADFVQASVLINAAPIWILPMILTKAKRLGVKRIVALSSTSVLTKRVTANLHELEIVRALEDGERYIERFCNLFDIEYTVIRTTMIFDGVNDKNVATIAKLLKWLPRFPLPGGGTGLRQPIHADDVADACVAALRSNQSYGKVYNIGGGQTLSYREMVATIAQAAGYRARFVSLPMKFLRFALRIFAHVPGFRHLTASMADRVDEDLCFKNDRFIIDCGFSPRPFSMSIETIRSR
ncbi:MAG: NAD-dependent epimerase/dehydratase family protein, partial [Gammaproteobacteria bacterium]|nr:NAD-dependent epimerase/dehydratase family protein [Gammaproteobacteria bacterium]